MAIGRAIIMDGFIDEPTALGVPPYLAPYPRYVAGTLAQAGIPWRYLTVEQWRRDPEAAEALAELGRDGLLVIVAGLTVPGHYRGGTPMTLAEAVAMVDAAPCRVLVGGPIQHGYSLTGGTRALVGGLFERLPVVGGDLDAAVADLLDGRQPTGRQRDYGELDERARRGAVLAAAHPGFPHIMVEVESARGCERPDHCSFCTEGLSGPARFRPAESILAELEALAASGVRHVRIGKQPNLFAWPGRRGPGGEVVPDPRAVAALYAAIGGIRPAFRTIHSDNVNPGFLAAFPGPCEEIAATIAGTNSPGDVAALGLESADPAVAVRNGLKASAAQTLTAVELLNRAGGWRPGRELPKLLPGINLVHGLPGESSATYEANYSFLRDLLERGLLVRRINMRQVISFPGTALHAGLGSGGVRINKGRFQRWKRRIQEEIEQPMLRLVAPAGTLLRGVVTEDRQGAVTFGRQLASYPLLVGFPLELPLGVEVDAAVIDHGFRSVTALPIPLRINELPIRALEAIPGIGRRRAERIVRARPLANWQGLAEALEVADGLRPLAEYISYELPRNGPMFSPG